MSNVFITTSETRVRSTASTKYVNVATLQTDGTTQVNPRGAHGSSNGLDATEAAEPLKVEARDSRPLLYMLLPRVLWWLLRLLLTMLPDIWLCDRR